MRSTRPMRDAPSKHRLPNSRLSWFQRQRVTVPETVPDFFTRPALVERLTPTEHGIVVLNAPGGFGKTTLLAECCRGLQEQGVCVGWLRIEGDEDRETIETYLTLSLRRAAIDVSDPLDPDAREASEDRLGELLQAIEDHGAPCVLALDDLERLTDADAIAALGVLLRRAPPNLHFAVACRELPTALDIAEQMLAGRAEILSADELRFSQPEVAEFFQRRLSRDQLTSLTRESAGWPIALRIQRNEKSSGTPGQAQAFHEVLGNWLESRLWHGISADDRDFLLDIGLFDRIDPELIDEALDGNDSRHRLETMRDLAGLIEVDDDGFARLHKMVRDHCVRQRYRESPERFRSIHRRAATACVRRGETVAAMRHAAQAGDAHAIGEILEDAGGFRFWLLNGPPAVADTDPYLTHEVVDRHPRLGLARCGLLLLGDRIEEAKRVYDRAAANTDGFTRNPTGDDDDIHIDHCLTQAVALLQGCRPLGVRRGSVDAGARESTDPAGWPSSGAPAGVDLASLVQDDGLDPRTRCALEFGLCIVENQRARFDAAYAHARRSQSVSDDSHPYLDMHLDFELGGMAMAQGQVEQATTCYARGLKTAKANHPADATPVAIGNALLRELELERNRLSRAVAASFGTRSTFIRSGNTFASYAAECAIFAELTQQMVGGTMALESLAETWEYARRTNRVALARYLSALRVSLLVGAGQVAEAERTWNNDGLPTDANECLTVQNWREMEALACARLRLHAAQGAFEPGREFARQLLRTAQSHGLVRTTMRGLAITMSLEQSAGDPDAACARLGEFLHLYATSDYARPLVREGETGKAVLDRLRDSTTDDALNVIADQLLESIGAAAQESVVTTFGARELEVLGYLADWRDNQIAAKLRITHDGVRYHIRRIFAKLGVHNRHEAVQRARAIGLLIDEP